MKATNEDITFIKTLAKKMGHKLSDHTCEKIHAEVWNNLDNNRYDSYYDRVKHYLEH